MNRDREISPGPYPLVVPAPPVPPTRPSGDHGHLSRRSIRRLAASGASNTAGRTAALGHIAVCPSCRQALLIASGLREPSIEPDEVEPGFPELTFWVESPAGPPQRADAVVRWSGWRAVGYRLNSPRDRVLSIEITAPRPAVAQFLGTDASGQWMTVARPVSIDAPDPVRSDPIAGLTAGQVLVVALTEEAASEAIAAAIQEAAGGEPGGAPTADRWVGLLATRLFEQAGHCWLEAPLVEFL